MLVPALVMMMKHESEMLGRYVCGQDSMIVLVDDDNDNDDEADQ